MILSFSWSTTVTLLPPGNVFVVLNGSTVGVSSGSTGIYTADGTSVTRYLSLSSAPFSEREDT